MNPSAHWTLFTVLLVMSCTLSAAAAQDATNHLANPGFEEGTAEALKGWTGYGQGYTVDRVTRHRGERSIRCTARGEEDGMGAVQIVKYDRPDKRPVIVGGWSKAKNVGGGGDYCVYLDILHEDGTPWWGKTSGWRRGTHDWEYSARVYCPAKPVREIQTFVFIRRTAGTAWFDDIKLCRGGLHLTNVCLAPDYPRSRNGLHLSARLTQKADWRCDLVAAALRRAQDGGTELVEGAAAGDVLDSLTGSGDRIHWYWRGRAGAVPDAAKITAETPGGEKIEFLARATRPPRAPNPVESGYVVWTMNSMKKVYPTDLPPSPAPPPEAGLTVARNEREGLQVAIRPADDVPLKDVRIQVGRFLNERGDAFPAELIQWHVVGYIWVQTPSWHPSAPAVPNWCPEVLLPARPFDVVDGRTQTVWLNFFASDEVKPGTYRGRVEVRPANAGATDVILSVRVRRFSLPRAPRMKTAFAIMDGFTKHMYGGLTPRLRRRCLDIMLDHRLNPDDISRTEPPRIEDLLYARERGMNAFNVLNLVPRPKGRPLWVCFVPLSAYGPSFNQELAARLDDYIAQLRRHGLSKMAYFYGFDERREEYDDFIKGICRFLKERYPEVSTFTTAGYMYHKRGETPPDYEDYMDWYCPLTSAYKPELSERLRAIGKRVWWYVCCGPRHPYANFASMDYPSIEGRLLAWMTYGYEADGLLFWHVNYWGGNTIVDQRDPYLDWKPACIARMTGDGVLVYPTPQGPVSSIRLENIRDGIEDYDYLCLLADLKGRAAAMKYFSRLVKSMREYTRDPGELYEVRRQMADDIDRAAQHPGPVTRRPE